MIDAPPEIPVIQDLVRCGLDSAGLSISFDDELQSSVVTVARKAGGDASKFTCIRSAVWGKVDLAFQDNKLASDYRSFEAVVGLAEAQWQARHWLAERDMLKKLPDFADGTPPERIIWGIEQFCSIEPGEALALYSPTLITLRPDFLQPLGRPEFECLINVMMLIDLEKHGLEFGLIGNEAIAQEEQK
ncbi:hypothetical protein [Sphingopyxis chilensis]